MTETFFRDAILSLGAAGPLVMAIWHDAPKVEHMRALRRQAQQSAKTHPGKVMRWNAVLGGTPVFTEEVRAELNAILRDPDLQGVGTAHVILIEGFAGAATRGFLGASLLASRPSTPTKVFGDVPTASTWLAGRGQGITGAPDAATIAQLHRELSALK